MKNKLFFLCFAGLLFSVTVNSQSTWNSQFNKSSVQVPKKLNDVDVYLTNISYLMVTVRLTNVEDGTEYMYYPVSDFPVSGWTELVGSVPYGIYTVEIGDYGASPITKLGKTDCDLDYNKRGEPLFWYNHDIGQCSSFTIIRGLP